jgi:preprotein translocase subunit YajC
LPIPVFLIAATVNFVAQTTQATTRSARPPLVDMLTSPMIPILLVMVVFIWMSTRSRRRQERQKREMISAMKRGDRVQTIGGILGNVVEARDDRILLKVDEGNNTKIWFARSAIHRVLGEEAEVK